MSIADQQLAQSLYQNPTSPLKLPSKNYHPRRARNYSKKALVRNLLKTKKPAKKPKLHASNAQYLSPNRVRTKRGKRATEASWLVGPWGRPRREREREKRRRRRGGPDATTVALALAVFVFAVRKDSSRSRAARCTAQCARKHALSARGKFMAARD